MRDGRRRFLVAVAAFGVVVATGTPSEIQSNADVVEAYVGSES